MGNNNGFLVISLDFELLWGVFDKVDYLQKFQYFRTTKEIIPQILNLFQKYDIACTWASVGMLFNTDWEEWTANIPSITPDYSNKAFSAYEYGRSITSPKTQEICFAPELLSLINESPRQEIGTHTYSHYYCLEPGQGLKAFEADLEKAIAVARERGISIESLVFPRNQFNSDYLAVCNKLGITSVRTNPEIWYWKDTQKDSLSHKLFRTGDAYLGKGNKSYPIEEVEKEVNAVLLQKASRLLRPYSKNKILEFLKLRRIKREMTKAARMGEVYHLWWHPHNFGSYPQQNLRQLEEILQHFKSCQKKYNFGTVNMGELTRIVNGK